MLGGAVFLGIWGDRARQRRRLDLAAGAAARWSRAALLVPAYVVHARSASRRDYAVLPLRLFRVARLLGRQRDRR